MSQHLLRMSTCRKVEHPAPQAGELDQEQGKNTPDSLPCPPVSSRHLHQEPSPQDRRQETRRPRVQGSAPGQGTGGRARKGGQDRASATSHPQPVCLSAVVVFRVPTLDEKGCSGPAVVGEASAQAPSAQGAPTDVHPRWGRLPSSTPSLLTLLCDPRARRSLLRLTCLSLPSGSTPCSPALEGFLPGPVDPGGARSRGRTPGGVGSHLICLHAFLRGPFPQGYICLL